MSKAVKSLKIATIIVLAVGLSYCAVVKAFNVPEKIMKKIYPRKYSEHVENYSEEYNVDPLLVYAVIKVESNFNNDVVSKSNAKGLMQLMDSTATEISTNKINDTSFDCSKLFDAETNIKIGVKYLSVLLDKYNGNIYVALAAYNAGIGNVDNWIEQGIIQPDGSDIENIPYKETNNYVRKIVRDYGIYQKLYE